MIPDSPSADGSPDDDDPVAVIETGRRGQRLILEGWFASHADAGTPGAHIHLRTSDREDAVVRTDQIPDLVTALSVVSERIDHMWAVEGDEYAEDVVLRAPDPQDPETARQRRIDHMMFMQLVADNLPEVTRLLARSASTDQAVTDLAALLDVEEGEVVVRFARFNMLALTRAAYDRRVQLLDDGEDTTR